MGCGQDRAVAEREPHRSFLREVGAISMRSTRPGRRRRTIAQRTRSRPASTQPREPGRGDSVNRRQTSNSDEPWAFLAEAAEDLFEWSISTAQCELCCEKPGTCDEQRLYECGCGPRPALTGVGGGVRPKDLEPPPDYQSDCPEWMSGNSTTCQAPIDRQDKEAILALDPESMRGYVQFDDLDAAGEELVLRAWAFLRANEDLIRWAFCWVQGDATNAERVIRKLHGTDANTGFFQSRVQFSVKGAGQGNCSSQGEVDAQDYTYAYGTPTVWGGSIVFCNYVFDGQETWDTFVSNWSAENDYSRACQVIHLAGRLLHELGHAVEAVEPDPNGFDACHDSYIVENTFVYGALTRFPDAAAEYCSSVCSVSKNEVSLLFGSDGLGGSYYDDGRAALPDLEVAGCGEVNP